MNISKVSASNAIAVSNKSNSIVDALQKQKMELAKKIENVKGSKEDPKIKAEKIKQFTEQMAEIDKQIMQAKIEEKQKEIQEAQEKNAEKAALEKYEQEDDEHKDGVVLSASLNNLISASNSFSEYKNLHSVHTNLEGKVHIAQSEIKNSHNGGSVKYQMDVVAKVGSRISSIEDSMAKKVVKINKDVEKSINTGIKEAEKARGNNELKEKHEEKIKGDTTVDNTSEVPVENVHIDVNNTKSIQKDKKDTKYEENTLRHKSIDMVV